MQQRLQRKEKKMQTPRTELKARRLAHGMTALKLALATGSTEGRLYALERGRGNPSRDEAEAIGRALGVKPETVFPELSQRAAR
jgi:transcriptional regulator with XRE-family HTH domain